MREKKIERERKKKKGREKEWKKGRGREISIVINLKYRAVVNQRKEGNKWLRERERKK